jgi:hypothetical protein
VFNLTNPQTVFRDIESPLKYQTRCVTAFPDATGYLVGSIEGRVAVHHVQDQLQNKNFTFKCHRDNTDVYAVNSMAFHPQVPTFPIYRKMICTIKVFPYSRSYIFVFFMFPVPFFVRGLRVMLLYSLQRFGRGAGDVVMQFARGFMVGLWITLRCSSQGVNMGCGRCWGTA